MQWALVGRANTGALQVAGESGLGKTTFINTLFSTTIKNYADHKRRHQKQVDKTVEIEITKAELEEKFFKGMHVQDRTRALAVLDASYLDLPLTRTCSPPHRH